MVLGVRFGSQLRSLSLQVGHSLSRWLVAALPLFALSVSTFAEVPAECPQPREASPQVPSGTPQSPAGPQGPATANRFTFRSADGQFTIRVGGYVQADSRWFRTADAGKSQFLIRRARPYLEGNLTPSIAFRILPDFAGSQATLFDAYVDWRFSPELEVRVGKFKPPIGLERLQSATSTMFVERGLPTNLVPNRDLGVQLSGKALTGQTDFALGVFNGAADGVNANSDSNGDKDVVGRLFTALPGQKQLPLLQGLRLGVAGSFGHSKGTSSARDLPVYRSFGQADVFQYRTASGNNPAVFADGARWRLAPQAYWAAGPWSLLAEWVNAAQGVRGGSSHRSLQHRAWQVASGWVLTGEPASFQGVTPRRSFSPQERQWGAWEIVARYGSLDIDGDAFRFSLADRAQSIARATEWAVGLNGYLNAYVRVMASFGHTSFAGGRVVGDRPDEDVALLRVQLAF